VLGEEDAVVSEEMRSSEEEGVKSVCKCERLFGVKGTANPRLVHFGICNGCPIRPCDHPPPRGHRMKMVVIRFERFPTPEQVETFKP
jgi:hypothetical protein